MNKPITIKLSKDLLEALLDREISEDDWIKFSQVFQIRDNTLDSLYEEFRREFIFLEKHDFEDPE